MPYTRANPKPVTERTIPQGAATTACPARFSVLLSTGTTSILLHIRLRVHLFFVACSAAHPIGEHSDRVSLLVPHLLGANRRPTGERGFLMHWRTGGDVVIADAFRLTNHST